MGSSADYSLKVWAVVILITPLILTFEDGILEGLYVFVLFYSFFYSLPALLLFLAITYFLNKTGLKAFIKKLIFSVSGVAFIYGTFFILGIKLYDDIMFKYCGVLIAAIFIFKLKPPQKPVKEIEIKN